MVPRDVRLRFPQAFKETTNGIADGRNCEIHGRASGEDAKELTVCRQELDSIAMTPVRVYARTAEVNSMRIPLGRPNSTKRRLFCSSERANEYYRSRKVKDFERNGVTAP